MSIRARASSGILALLLLCVPRPSAGQKPGGGGTAQDSADAVAITAGESDGERHRTLLKALDLNLGFTTLRIGGGILEDAAAFAQDSASLLQLHAYDDIKVRDARILLGGRLNLKRVVTWQMGIMYDGLQKKALIRQSGVMIAVPEIHSHFFIGRGKVGASLNKVMTGYDGWSMERLPFTDATIPLFGDGIKWLGTVKNHHLFWNVGAYTDWLSEKQTLVVHDHVFAARVGWVPLVADSSGTLLHFGFSLQAGKPNGDTLRLKSKPESFEAPSFIDTGTFPAQSTLLFGPEIYFRPGRFMLGVEYYWQKVNSAEVGDNWFHGGEISATLLPTGETRTYNTVGHYFRGIKPIKTVIQGGPGAWEPVIKFSYSNLNGATKQGGIFWRITPMVNWHLTDNLRIEFAYGYGTLDRKGLTGVTQFLQSRIQFQM